MSNLHPENPPPDEVLEEKVFISSTSEKVVSVEERFVDVDSL